MRPDGRRKVIVVFSPQPVCRHFAIVLMCCAVLLLSVGCGKEDASRGNLSGKVTLDGKPVELGTILLTPIEGAKGVVTGGSIENGRYQLVGKAAAAVGRNRVEVRAMRKTGRMVPKPFTQSGETIEEQVEAVPARFNSESKLSVDVKPGDNTADFEVSSR
jgi:hypothetical protein